MMATSQHIDNLNRLRAFVYETLCYHEQLELGVFEMTERILLRSGSPCGIHFCLHGPRAVQFTAIWETERNTILFYDSTGERYCRTQLAESPCLQPVAA